jgi:hypothetical protein
MKLVARQERRSRKRPPFAHLLTPETPNQIGVDADKGDVSPRQGKVAVRRFAAAAACALLAAWPSAAAAETASPSVAAQIAHAEFLPYMDPPPGEPATVCLVDTGVDLNPDTQSNVVSRVALDGGDGGDVWDRKHGTEMAMMMGAPVNGWGTVGAWPFVRIVSVRAMPSNASGFAFNSYARSILACLNVPTVRVINLSFSGPRPSDADLSEFTEYVGRARRAGVSVVAGAGNGGGAVEYPAASDQRVFGVSASGPDNQLCAFSASGPGVAIAAPGCALELADPLTGQPVSYGGTSPAAAFVSSTLAALRSYRPDLGAAEAELLLRDASSGGVVDVASAFRAAGLGSLVSEATTRATGSGTALADATGPRGMESVVVDAPSTTWPAVAPSSDPALQWPQPRVRSRRCASRGLLLRLSNRQRNVTVIVRGYRRRGEFGTRLVARRAARKSTLALPSTFDLVSLQYFGSRRKPSTNLVIRGCASERR